MIRIWFTPQMDYQSFRVEYVRRLVAYHALRLDNKKVLQALFPEDSQLSDSELKTKYMPGKDFGKQYYERDKLGIIPGLQSMLFLKDGNINIEGLLHLLAGPDKPPNCVTRSAAPEGQLRPWFRQLHEEIIEGIEKKNETDAMDLCKSIFCYDNDNIREAAIWLLDQLQVRTCPYCNRVYTTHARSSGIRPSLDHFFPKSKHPYFALSLFNLVPSCDYCNRKKGDGKKGKVSPDLKDDKGEWLIFPYDECYNDDECQAAFQMEETVKSQFWKALRGESKDFKLSIGINRKSERGKQIGKQVQNTFQSMGIEAIYSKAHWQEVQKLAKLHYRYSHTYLKDILSVVLGADWKNLNAFTKRMLLERSKELLYFADLNPANWGNAPLNKLKADILAQLDKYEEAGRESIQALNQEGEQV